MNKLLILLIILSSVGLFGQTLQYEGVNPFGIQVVSMDSIDTSLRLTMQIDFVDLDGDEDMDILYTGLRLDTLELGPATDGSSVFMEMQKNLGTKTNPLFGERKKVFDSLEYPSGTAIMFIDAGDLNGDGLTDLVCSAEIDSTDYQSYLLFYFQNPDQSFTKLRCTDFELDEFIRNSIFVPELTDMDLDGDLDLMVSGTVPDFNDPDIEIPVIMYAKNTGSLTNPEFLGWFYYPYGLDPATSAVLIRTGDLDLDGDLDAFGIDLGSDPSQFKYAQNSAGPDGRPSFDGFELNFLGISPPTEDEVFLVPELCDIDGDGDLDVFIVFLNELFPSFHYYENIDCEPVQFVIDESICEGESYIIDEVEYSESGSYYISTTLSSGCIENTELTLEVIEIDATVQASNAVLTAVEDEGLLYQWFDCDTNQDIDGAIQSEFEVPYSGSFAVEITDTASGCMEVSSCYYVIASNTSTSLEQKIIVMPNPSTGRMQLINNTDYEIDHVKVYNPVGSIIKDIKGPDIREIEIEKQKNGLYYLKIYSKGKVFVKEIILMK